MQMHPRLKKAIVIGYDLLAVGTAWLLSYWFRFNLDAIPSYWLDSAISFLPFLLFSQLLAFYAFGLYRGIWRFVSIPDLIRISKAVMTGAVFISVFSFFASRAPQLPRSVPILYALFLMTLLCLGRVYVRWLKDYRGVFRQGKRTLIVGAGSAGEQLARDLLRHTLKEYTPIVFVDDNPTIIGKEIHGVRVVGTCKNLSRIVTDYQIELILIALPSANSTQMRQIVSFCEATGIPVRTLPSIRDVTYGNVSINALREVSLEDLLGRDPVDLDWDIISHGICGKRILVTGGGGSIGSELCRQIARLDPEELTVIEQNEFNLYTLEMELKNKFKDLSFRYYLMDVANEADIQTVISETKPNIIFHAAAYKHVPLLENQVVASMKNNVLGTEVMCKAAITNNVDKFVLISTDKAVNPTNVMGATKRVAELACQYFDGTTHTKFITVRFGNVLGSIGSVIPLFKQQIAQGGPVTVTHPDITRFFMTIPEATQLILQASSIGTGGEICVLDMGEPIKITYLAEQMIRLAGLQPGKDINIVYSGLRPGEKLYEELFYEGELHSRTSKKKIFTVKCQKSDIAMHHYLKKIKNACDTSDTGELLQILMELVPKFHANSDFLQSVDIAIEKANII